MARAIVPQETILELSIEWSGPYSITQVRKEFNRGGSPPEYNGPDYGLYQIYGRHILGGDGTLLYIGKAIQQTFSARISDVQILRARNLATPS